MSTMDRPRQLSSQAMHSRARGPLARCEGQSVVDTGSGLSVPRGAAPQRLARSTDLAVGTCMTFPPSKSLERRNHASVMVSHCNGLGE